MRVQFLKDHLEYEDGEPMYQESEIAHIKADTALEWEKAGILIRIPSDWEEK